MVRVSANTILSFCLLADTTRLYGFRHDGGIFFVIMDQKRRMAGFWCGVPFGPDHSEEAYNG